MRSDLSHGGSAVRRRGAPAGQRGAHGGDVAGGVLLRVRVRVRVRIRARVS